MDARTEAEALLRRLTGTNDATFRAGQWEAIERLVSGRARVLVVQRTGWGKSAVYFIATRLLRQGGSGPTLLVSPLLALMRNQLEMARRSGVRADSQSPGAFFHFSTRPGLRMGRWPPPRQGPCLTRATAQPGPGWCGGSYHTHRHPGARQATVKCPQMARSGCSVWAPGHQHRSHDTSTRPGPHSCPFSHRSG
jgi:hypothetical protein